MTKITCTLLLALLAITTVVPVPARAQAAETRQLLLNVKKLEQLRSILTDMKKGYVILQTGYGAIRDISQGSFTLHQTFLDGLLAINPALRQYDRVADILASQQRLLYEYREASRQFREAGVFSPAELHYIGQVYENLAARSLRQLEELTLVLTAGKLRMQDDERLALIDRIYQETNDGLVFLRHFNRLAKLLSLQRIQEQNNIRILRQQYPAPGYDNTL